MKMIYIQTSTPYPYSDGVIKNELRDWKNVRSRKNKESRNIADIKGYKKN